MFIDLHCHTRATKKGDGAARNVTPEKFSEAIQARQVSIVGITNHNLFDRAQYNQLVNEVGSYAQLWPGVELDVHDSGNDEGPTARWHMIVISNPDRIDAFSEALTSILGNSLPNDFFGEVSDVLSAFLAEGQDVLFISHCRKKSPYISDTEINRLEAMVPEGERWRLFLEEKDLRTIGIWSYEGKHMVFGSDVKDWNNYASKDSKGIWTTKLPELRLKVDGFSQLAKLAQRDGRIVKTLLGDRGPNSFLVHPHKNVDVQIQLYDEVNVIFGGKGTGKTEILNSLEPTLVNQGKRVSVYHGSAKAQQFDELLLTDGIGRRAEDLGRESCSEEISELAAWADVQPTPIVGYIDWKRTEGNSGSKARFRITRGSNLPTGTPDEYQFHLHAAKVITEFIERCNGEDNFLQYLSKEDAQELMHLLTALLEGAKRKAREAYIEYKALLLTNLGLASIKRLADGKSDTKSKPGDTGFLRYATGRVTLGNISKKLYVQSGEKGDETDCKYDFAPLGVIDDKGDMEIVTRWRYLSSKSRTKEFNVGIRDLNEIRAKWKTISENIGASNIGSNVKAVSEKCKGLGVDDLTAFIGVWKYGHIVGTDNNSEYMPSDGEKGMLMLNKVLKTDADAYLLDEPEAGMGNSYIEASIRPMVSKRGKERRMVVVATHNANLAVRTLPYASIYREHISGDKYCTYEGNPFANELIDVEGVRPPISWSARSMEVLEGGAEAFGDRASIYAAGKVEVEDEDN